MRFGLSLPTSKEGLSLPNPFSDLHQILDLAQLAEKQEYDSIWVNDHITPPSYVRQKEGSRPRFYEALLVLAATAAMTQRVKLGTAALVLPFRDPVLLAKEFATLDHLSLGRTVIGLGSGAYREEFVALRPRLAKANRGRMMDEGLMALRLLLGEESASFEGEYVAFRDVQIYPKPVQSPFPIYLAGNSPSVLRRAARFAHGWMPAVMPPSQLAKAQANLAEELGRHGRASTDVEIAPQFMCCIDQTHEAAVDRFRASPYYVHLKTLRSSTLRDQDLEKLENLNLVGTPEGICERIETFARVGISHLPAISFVSPTAAAMAEDVEMFASQVIAAFAGSR